MKERLSTKDSIIHKLDSLYKVYQVNEVIYKRDLQLYKDQVLVYKGREDNYWKLIDNLQKETKHYKSKSLILEIALGLLLIIEVVKH